MQEKPQDGPGWLGVELALRKPNEPGVLIRDVTPDSPASRAGIEAGDVLLSIDGEQVTRPTDVVRLVAIHRAGERVALAFRRGEGDRLVGTVLAARPDMAALMSKTFVGSPAPHFGELTAVQGTIPEDIGGWKGKVVVLEFWASWCVPCRMTAPKLNAWHERFKAEGLEVLGITTDPVVFASQAAVEFGIGYSVASDDSQATSRTFRALSIPTLFVIDREGVVRRVVVGYSSDELARTEELIETLIKAR
jgi:thiol-disulfide isomerase/thioredoxin